MANFPNRCQHIKVNGTQCGSPALRRNRFCYFHKRHHEQRIAFNADRLHNNLAKDARRRRNIAIDLPVLEDANSIQISLMQIMRLIVAGQLDTKTAGLLLYALQTASVNLSRTSFEPNRYDVILDPAAVGKTPLGESIWDDSDFEEDEETDEETDEDEEEESAEAASEEEETGEEEEESADDQNEDEENNAEENNDEEDETAATPAKRAAQPTGKQVRAQLRTQILKELPIQTLERLAGETSGSSA
jgi:hypothetical protein